jgi:DNA replication initiation complex subunit (GINS family)
MEKFEVMAFALGCIGTLCWAVCFWWMHRISSRQDAMLEEVHEMTKRVEKLSQAEHDLMSDVHPQVSEIKEHVQNVEEAVSPEKSCSPVDRKHAEGASHDISTPLGK